MPWFTRSFAADRVLHKLLYKHFRPHRLTDLAVHERKFPLRAQADVQRALDLYMAKVSVRHFSGIQQLSISERPGFTALLVDNPQLSQATTTVPQYEEVDVGDAEPVRCLRDALWLLEGAGRRFAVMLMPPGGFEFMTQTQGIRLQVAVSKEAAALPTVEGFFSTIEKTVQAGSSYRGKILSLEMTPDYTGRYKGVKVHKLDPVMKDQIILPQQTLDLLDRNIVRFVQQRPQLVKLGLSAKKGLLFYGPPGTGKTHTIHYLTRSLPGVTTLLITEEQVNLLGEYLALARLLQPSMVVVEDADLIAKERTTMPNVCQESFLFKLLNEMDGLRPDAEILFILTTNRPETLEPALTARPGRIDQAVEFPLPDDSARERLIRLYACSTSVPDEVVCETVKRTSKVSAAFIKELMRRATQVRLERDGGTEVALSDIDAALHEMLFIGGTLNRKLLGGQGSVADVFGRRGE